MQYHLKNIKENIWSKVKKMKDKKHDFSLFHIKKDVLGMKLTVQEHVL